MRKYKNTKNQLRFRKNEEIRIKEVRLVGEDGTSTVMPTKKALSIAENKNLDLVEINDKPNPSICKIIDYGKFLYDEKKKKRDFEKKQRDNIVKVKEIRLGPNTGDHDMEFKANHAINFLEDGNKVNVNILFKGRSIVHKERGELTLLRFAEMLQEYGMVENLPVLNGRKMDMNIKPLKKK